MAACTREALKSSGGACADVDRVSVACATVLQSSTLGGTRKAAVPVESTRSRTVAREDDTVGPEIRRFSLLKAYIGGGDTSGLKVGEGDGGVEVVEEASREISGDDERDGRGEVRRDGGHDAVRRDGGNDRVRVGQHAA